MKTKSKIKTEIKKIRRGQAMFHDILCGARYKELCLKDFEPSGPGFHRQSTDAREFPGVVRDEGEAEAQCLCCNEGVEWSDPDAFRFEGTANLPITESGRFLIR